MPHLYARRYFEVIPAGFLDTWVPSYKSWFTPQYVLADFNENISINAYAENQYQNFIEALNSNYTLYAKNGTAELYKLD